MNNQELTPQQETAQPLFWIASERNNWGMAGSFRAITSMTEGQLTYHTVFTDNFNKHSVCICQHENLKQAEEMAKDFNDYVKLMWVLRQVSPANH